MADLLISLISKIATFPFTKRLIETLRPIVRQSKTRRDAFRSEISSLPRDEEMARVWFTRANSLPMPIGIGLGLEWAGGEYSEDGAFRRNALAWIQVTREGTTPGAASLTAEEKAALIKGSSELLRDVLGKPLDSTFVLIEEVDTDNWGWGGLPALEFRRRREDPPGSSA